MRGTAFLRAVGRLKPDITEEQAFAALQLLGEQLSRRNIPKRSTRNPARVAKTLPEDVTENLRPGFATLLAAVTFVLLIACSNVANLLLVRFSGRRREISLRMALGASRASVLRLFVFESVLVSLLAGILGAALAWQLVPLVPKLAANFLPIEAGSATALSFPVLAFTLALSLADRPGHGPVSGAAKFARGHGGGAEGRRPRDGGQRAATAVSQITGRRAGGALGYPARGSIAAHREFHAAESIRTPDSSRTISGSA